ncbi:Uncharacterised protein [Trueperella bialowiezensis]|uniref:Uncharacterized protein n=1 Tax=Trueperella bialowiezensis TaxID=312285 RepID=A0A3S4VAL3_9ACTO|nr:Uncharacterised protein [Trueperella bialowiezensis]
MAAATASAAAPLRTKSPPAFRVRFSRSPGAVHRFPGYMFASRGRQNAGFGTPGTKPIPPEPIELVFAHTIEGVLIFLANWLTEGFKKEVENGLHRK